MDKFLSKFMNLMWKAFLILLGNWFMWVAIDMIKKPDFNWLIFIPIFFCYLCYGLAFYNKD